jgi:WD40 repeat protein
MRHSQSQIRFSLYLAVSLLAGLIVSSAGELVQAQSAGPSRDPILRIETGMHTAMIKRVSVDAANRFLVTGSEDKTVRVWELPSGTLLRVLRPPVGAGNEGKIYSVAISPDGQTIAAGGWTGYEWEKANSIYLFDRASGRVVQRISGLRVVDHLVYSPDGRYLAAALGGKNGVRVFETSSYRQIGEDKEYGGDSYGADFDAADRLVTTSYDGYIHLYELAGSGTERSLRLVAKQKAAGGNQPFSVRFSPDGRRIAVGFSDTTSVNVLDAGDLSLLYAPDTSGAKYDLSSVAWSVDGNLLYAGGRYLDANDHMAIRSWANSGRGSYRDLPVGADNTIMDLLALRTGGVVFGAFDPAFGTIDASGKQTLFTGPNIADYRNNQQGFLLSSDASIVRFSYELFGKSPASFSLSGRQLDTSATSAPSNLQPPRTEAQGLNIAGWRGTDEPKLNGKPLKLEQYETSRRLAIAPDASGFLLGTEWSIRYFDRTGAEKWNVSGPGIAWAVNISGDGRIAVAAFSDGTIRWYRMTDGKELLAFFPHADRKRWVMWTPSGYYDAAPGAEDLIGWNVNNGKEAAADFFPAGQFRNTFYRPDVVAKVLQTGDEALALKLANEENGRKQQQAQVASQLPPVVEIVSPSDNSEVPGPEVTVLFNIRAPSGEAVTGVRALVNGRPAQAARQLTREDLSSSAARELTVSIPPGKSEISIVAENRYASSVPATVRVRQRSIVAVAQAESQIIKPKLYILAIGVTRYQNQQFNTLSYPDKDARDFVGAMQAQKGLLYRDVIVYHDKAITDGEATKDEILDGLDWIRKQTTSNDVAMVFMAGHGVNDQNNYYYFCPFNVDAERLLRTGVAYSDIRNTVSAIAGKALFFVDTCHSGNSIGQATRRGPLDINVVINELSSAENGVVVFSASTGSESSYEDKAWNNGAFTRALVEGLNGQADLLGRGGITYSMLSVYISDRVKDLTKGKQHPTMISPKTIPDFPIAMKR